MNVDHLKQRAEIVQRIRSFFLARDVLEVTTPCVVPHAVSDVHIESISLNTTPPAFLRTSPESAHKWLLSEGLKSFYELGPVFRGGELGRHHQPEFTLLEWYRADWSWQALAEEVLALVSTIASAHSHDWPSRWQSWSDACIDAIGCELTPDEATHWQRWVPEEIRHWPLEDQIDHVFARHVQSTWPRGEIHVIYDYPIHQKALAELTDTGRHAKRFEVFVGPVELANGYQELRDLDEQRRRFNDDLVHRQHRQRPCPAPDARLLGALEAGLPRCAGVALGVDRLVMLALGLDDINQAATLSQTHGLSPKPPQVS